MTNPELPPLDVPTLAVAGVSKTFVTGPAAVVAVNDCTLSVRSGELVALSGPSGSGKSTLLGMILGWITPDSGTIDVQPTERAIAVTSIPQELALLTELTAEENIQIPALFHPVGSNGDAAIADLGLEPLLSRLPAELSMGEQQRVAIARAITTDAAVIVADEPTSHQDEENADRVMSVLRRAADRGAAVLLTTHDPRNMASCDRHLEIVDGQMVGRPAPLASGDDSIGPSAEASRNLGTRLARIAGAPALVAVAVVLSLIAWSGPGTPTDTAVERSSSESASEDNLPATPGYTVVQVPSDALGVSQRTIVFLPPGYEETERKYPVLYLLHGQMDRPEMFRRIGIFRRATELMQRGEVEPFIIVAPDIDNSFGVNNPESEVIDVPDGSTLAYDGGRYEDFLETDLIEFVDSTYRTIDGPAGRFVGGISMGGFAALHLAFRHPHLFSKVGGHSPALIDEGFTWLYPSAAVAETRNPIRLAATADLRNLDVFLDAGESDRLELVGPITELEQALSGGRSTTVGIWPGGHTDTYWRRHVDTYLRFYSP